ncbi:hypothetical protein EJ110_NYTH13495 [Nymphaea thermarum]|nr:hypothetical protein EJ110_NYTH13495 [Nymphaea thermarum]
MPEPRTKETRYEAAGIVNTEDCVLECDGDSRGFFDGVQAGGASDGMIAVRVNGIRPCYIQRHQSALSFEDEENHDA